MFVPDEIRKCVAFLAYDSPADGEILTGTAFFLILEEDGQQFGYLVTAAHIIEGMKSKGFGDEILVKVNKNDGVTAKLTTHFADWRFHPNNPVIDVAVLPIASVQGLDMLFYPAQNTVTEHVKSKEGIGLGDEVFVVGLYTKHSGRRKNIPIVRIGNIAAMPDEPLVASRGEMDGYLVETRSIGGISGSPVFVNLGALRARNTNIILGAGPWFYLLGLMHGRWDMKHLAPIMFEIDSDYLKQPLNSGIAIVVPVDKILEVINQPELAARRDTLRKA
jgi:hypothetical protein